MCREPDQNENAPPAEGSPPPRWQTAGVCLGLLLAVWFVFGPTRHHGFVNIDDDLYVYHNRLIKAGLTSAGIGWFFTHAYVDFWAPLTAISQMADCQFYGLSPEGHHLTNILLFAATVLLLFEVLRRLTGSLWPSAFVAAAWAGHPMRAESVAWITERKDLLSGLWFVLTLAAYARYVRRPRSWIRYLAVPVLFALGLMCKPASVTLPFGLLLLDYWPLRRLPSAAGWTPLVKEKIPLFGLAAASCGVTLTTAAATLVLWQQLPLSRRLGNAALSWVIYLRQTVYPASLAAFYPYPAHPAPGWESAAAWALLALMTAGAFAWRRTQPWLIVGWCWYLVMLLPTIGIVQSGEQAQADRFTYLPQIGLLVAITWTLRRACARWRVPRFLTSAAAALVLIALLLGGRLQAAYWRDSATLWRHTLACTGDNSFAQNNLGVALREQGDRDEAAAHFRAAVAIQPANAQAQYNLGNSLFQAGHADEAIACYGHALAHDPAYFDALNNLGIALASQGRTAEAAATYRRALTLQPESVEVHGNLARALLDSGATTEALAEFAAAVNIEPDRADSYANLGSALLRANRPAAAAAAYQKALDLKGDNETARSGLGSAFFLQGRLADAITNWRAVLALQPDKLSTLNNLAWVLATGPAELRNGEEAVRLAQRASALRGATNPVVLRTLAAAYAEAGRFGEARATAAAALKLAAERSNPALVREIEQQQVRYNAGQAFHAGL
jgi:tetratricopeptide (TPR) repeat protein